MTHGFLKRVHTNKRNSFIQTTYPLSKLLRWPDNHSASWWKSQGHHHLSQIWGSICPLHKLESHLARQSFYVNKTSSNTFSKRLLAVWLAQTYVRLCTEPIQIPDDVGLAISASDDMLSLWMLLDWDHRAGSTLLLGNTWTEIPEHGQHGPYQNSQARLPGFLLFTRTTRQLWTTKYNNSTAFKVNIQEHRRLSQTGMLLQYLCEEGPGLISAFQQRHWIAYEQERHWALKPEQPA